MMWAVYHFFIHASSAHSKLKWVAYHSLKHKSHRLNGPLPVRLKDARKKADAMPLIWSNIGHSVTRVEHCRRCVLCLCVCLRYSHSNMTKKQRKQKYSVWEERKYFLFACNKPALVCLLNLWSSVHICFWLPPTSLFSVMAQSATVQKRFIF